MRKRILVYILLAALPLLVYLPAFTNEFGANNDYALIPLSAENPQLYSETSQMFSIGRALGAYLLNQLAWRIHHITDLVYWRFASFLLMASVAGLLARFLRRRCGLEAFWALLIAGIVLALPPSQVFILWVAHALPGSLTLFLSLLSYLIWDRLLRVSPDRSLRCFFTAGLLAVMALVWFLCALWIYPPTAMFVFVGTFCHLLFPNGRRRGDLIRRLLADAAFYGIAIVIYYGLNLKVVIPWSRGYLSGFSEFLPDIDGTVYDLHLVAPGLLAKAPLVFDTLRVALAGVWHPFWPPAAAFSFAALVLGGLGLFFYRGQQAAPRPRINGPFFKKAAFYTLAGIVLFVLANAPNFLSKNCFHIPGYRVLAPAMVMVVLLQVALLRAWDHRLQDTRYRRVPRVLACLLAGCFFAAAGVSISDTVEHYKRELAFVKAQALAAQGRILINIRHPERKAALIDREPPFELGTLMSYDGWYASAIHEFRTRAGLPLLPIDLCPEEVLYLNPETYLIDFNEAVAAKKKSAFTRPPKLQVRFQLPPAVARQVTVYRKGNFFLFEQIIAGEKILLWLIPPRAGAAAWFQLDYPDGPQVIDSFLFGVFGLQGDHSLAVTCRLQGSPDNRHWQDLTIAGYSNPAEFGELTPYLVKDPAAYPHYRFYLNPARPDQVLPVQSIFLIPHIRE